MQLTQQYLLAMLTAETATAGPLDAVLVGLYTAIGDLGDGSDVSVITKTTYTGHAEVVVNDTDWSDPFLLGGAIPAVLSQQIDFRPTGSGASDAVIGVYILNAAGDKVIGVEGFDSPIVLAVPTDLLALVVQLTRDPNGNYGVAVRVT